MSRAAVDEILIRIRELPDDDRLVLDDLLAREEEAEWREEAAKAREQAKTQGIDQQAIDRAVQVIARFLLDFSRKSGADEGQVTIPTAIRQSLGLKAGQILEFDETTPYLVAVPVFDEPAMRALMGCTRGRLGKTTDEWLDETRGSAFVEEK